MTVDWYMCVHECGPVCEHVYMSVDPCECVRMCVGPCVSVCA